MAKYTIGKHPILMSVCSLVIVLGTVFWAIYRLRPLPLWEALLYGLIVAVFSGPVVLILLTHCLRKRADLAFRGDEPPTADALGFVERILIFAACVLGYGPPAIGGWMALKTIFQWKGWDEGEKKRFGEGRARFNLFLIGSAVSLLCVIGAVLFTLWLYTPQDLCSVFRFGLETKADD
jgi:hypothetical protein